MASSRGHLHDIALTEPVSWMPQTAGWWILLAILLLASAGLAIVLIRRRRANRYRRLALAELARIEALPGDSIAELTELPSLVKRTALCVYPRHEIAALSGESWLRFLDESYGGDGFVSGPGRVLPELAYAPDTVDLPAPERGELIALLRHWIRGHRVRV